MCRHRNNYKWIHHSHIEEIPKLLADSALNKLLSEVKSVVYFNLIQNETSDIYNLEQRTISLRFVDDNFKVKEIFANYCKIKSYQS